MSVRDGFLTLMSQTKKEKRKKMDRIYKSSCGCVYHSSKGYIDTCKGACYVHSNKGTLNDAEIRLLDTHNHAGVDTITLSVG